MRTWLGTLLFTILSCLAGLVVGCGQGGVNSGLDPSAPVDTLDTGQRMQLCRAVDDYLFRVIPESEHHRVACTVTALGSTLNQMACQSKVSSCLAGTPGLIYEHIDCSDPTTSGCTATVEQIESCIEARAREVDQRASEINCNAAGNGAEISRLSQPLPVPAACSSLSAQCRLVLGL